MTECPGVVHKLSYGESTVAPAPLSIIFDLNSAGGVRHWFARPVSGFDLHLATFSCNLRCGEYDARSRSLGRLGSPALDALETQMKWTLPFEMPPQTLALDLNIRDPEVIGELTKYPEGAER